MAVRRAAPVDERALFASYPFLPGAASLVDELAPSVGGLFREPHLSAARSAGRARIRSAMDDPTGARPPHELAGLGADEQFLSFQFARLLLSAAPGRGALRRWAVAEAKLAHHRLGREPDELLQEVGRRLGYELSVDGAVARLDLPSYLKLATPIREVDYRLTRQSLEAGIVTLRKERAVRLLEEGIRIELTEPLEIAEGTRGAIEERERELLEEIAKRLPAVPARGRPEEATVRPERFPPCIVGMERTLEAGENLSHAGRFALAAFLHKAGASFELIVDRYRGAPDFDESITRYQVESIRRKDGGAGYEPPDCATLRSHGLCLREGRPDSPDPRLRERDPLCFEPWLKHPLQYYRTRSGSERASGAPPAAPTGPGEAAPTVARAGPVASTAPAAPPGRERAPSTAPPR